MCFLDSFIHLIFVPHLQSRVKSVLQVTKSVQVMLPGWFCRRFWVTWLPRHSLTSHVSPPLLYLFVLSYSLPPYSTSLPPPATNIPMCGYSVFVVARRGGGPTKDNVGSGHGSAMELGGGHLHRAKTTNQVSFFTI